MTHSTSFSPTMWVASSRVSWATHRVNARTAGLSESTTVKSPSPNTLCCLRTASMPRIQLSSEWPWAICDSTFTAVWL